MGTTRPPLQGGSLLYCNPFPDWTDAGGVSAHFVLVLRRAENGNLMLAPITSKGDRCQLSLSLTSTAFPSLFAPGGLTREGSHLSLRDDRGNTTVYVWPAERTALRPVNGRPIPIDLRACLTPAEWTTFAAQLPESLRKKVQS
jgi:hypothetical protein